MVITVPDCPGCSRFKKELMSIKVKRAKIVCQEEKCFWELREDGTWEKDTLTKN